MNTPSMLALALALASASLAQSLPPPPPPPRPGPPQADQPAPPRPPAAGNLGGPLTGLTAAEMNLFRDGLNGFRQVETPDSGLGPIFNDSSCIVCHNAGGAGGASRRTVTRFGITASGHFDPLTDGAVHSCSSAHLIPPSAKSCPPKPTRSLVA